jgi:RIO-like serine/threonine protein kinase
MARNRLTLKVYYDILSAIHMIQKAGEHTTLSNIGYRAHVPNNRLERRIAELVDLSLLDAGMSVTERGYWGFDLCRAAGYC